MNTPFNAPSHNPPPSKDTPLADEDWSFPEHAMGGFNNHSQKNDNNNNNNKSSAIESEPARGNEPPGAGPPGEGDEEGESKFLPVQWVYDARGVTQSVRNAASLQSRSPPSQLSNAGPGASTPAARAAQAAAASAVHVATTNAIGSVMNKLGATVNNTVGTVVLDEVIEGPTIKQQHAEGKVGPVLGTEPGPRVDFQQPQQQQLPSTHHQSSQQQDHEDDDLLSKLHKIARRIILSSASSSSFVDNGETEAILPVDPMLLVKKGNATLPLPHTHITTTTTTTTTYLPF